MKFVGRRTSYYCRDRYFYGLTIGAFDFDDAQIDRELVLFHPNIDNRVKGITGTRIESSLASKYKLAPGSKCRVSICDESCSHFLDLEITVVEVVAFSFPGFVWISASELSDVFVLPQHAGSNVINLKPRRSDDCYVPGASPRVSVIRL